MSARLLRSQHGPAITPTTPEIVAAVTARLSVLAQEGESFTTPDLEETRWAAAFAQRATDWAGYRVRRVREGEYQDCHIISARIVARDPLRYRHVFGYALGSDAHWRTHSWVHDRQTGELIEPTPLKRRAYIGVELTPEEAADFEGEA